MRYYISHLFFTDRCRKNLNYALAFTKVENQAWVRDIKKAS